MQFSFVFNLSMYNIYILINMGLSFLSVFCIHLENIGIFTFARGFFADDKRLFTVRKNARAFSLHFQCKPTVCLQKRSLGPDSAVIF